MHVVREPGRAASRVGRPGALPTLIALASILVLTHGSAAVADEPGPMFAAAQVRYDEGMSLYAARAFAAAAQSFHAAYMIDPRREILFAEAQATRLGGDCATAVGLYQAFLETQPPPQQIEATRLALARCHEPGAQPVLITQAPPPTLGVVRPPPVAGSDPSGTVPGLVSHGPILPAAPVVHRIWWRDPLGLALAAGAIAGWGVAIGVGIAAARADGDARAAPAYQGFEERREVAEARARWAQRAAAVGAVLTAGAGSRFLWVGLSRAAPVAGVEGRF